MRIHSSINDQHISSINVIKSWNWQTDLVGAEKQKRFQQVHFKGAFS